MTAKMTAGEITDFLDHVFPQARGLFRIEGIGAGSARVRMPISEQHLRPGGTVSGPSMFWLADCAFYVAVLASIGPQAQAVTTNMNINFMRRPSLNDLVGEARILKLGRRLAVGDVTLFSLGDDRPVAHASVTYAIPDNKF
ncbi:MAG TPA: PaaI family thioesterase [Thermohalobaculum sp.]|nr:PaaI family thioesterase [Thermohalobaculum sp.]